MNGLLSQDSILYFYFRTLRKLEVKIGFLKKKASDGTQLKKKKNKN